MEKLSLTQQEHTFTNQNKCTTTQNKCKKLKPGLVASYDIRPGNGVGLFWFWHFINLTLTYLLRHLPTYLQPWDPQGADMQPGKLLHCCHFVLTTAVQPVANHHISITQLLSLWRHSHYDVIRYWAGHAHHYERMYVTYVRTPYHV